MTNSRRVQVEDINFENLRFEMEQFEYDNPTGTNFRLDTEEFKYEDGRTKTVGFFRCTL